MNLPNIAELSRLAESFYTINKTLEDMEEALREMRGEISAVRTSHSDLQSRVAALEEGRKTVDAQLRAVVAETVADLKVNFMEAKMELRVCRESQKWCHSERSATPVARSRGIFLCATTRFLHCVRASLRSK